MPRPLNKESCNTCRRRKVKCGLATPVCQQCAKSGRYCDRSERSLQFRSSSLEAPNEQTNRPRDALQDPKIATLFNHYITHLAGWYDLSDSTATFSNGIPQAALDEPLLFYSIIALSAMHVCKTSASTLRAVAESYHARWVQLVITLGEDDKVMTNGVALAATCLLRSYEILDSDVDPNMHLRGAYSMVSVQDLVLENIHRGLLAAGFWNYLREDITFSLFKECPLKMDLEAIVTPPHESDQDKYHKASTVQCYLAIVFMLALHASEDRYQRLECLRILDRELRPREELLEAIAFDICGITFTARTSSVIVNAFGLISYCARYIRAEVVRQELTRQLLACKSNIGWPVERLIQNLGESWRAGPA